MIDFYAPHLTIFVCGEDKKKIVISSSSDDLTVYKKCIKEYGVVDLDKSYLLKLSKREDRKKMLIDFIPSRYRVGKRFVFEIEALPYILGMSSEKGWDLHQGITFLSSEQIREKNDRRERRRLYRTLKILKYLNVNKDDFKIYWKKRQYERDRGVVPYLELPSLYVGEKVDRIINHYLYHRFKYVAGGFFSPLLYSPCRLKDDNVIGFNLSKENPLNDIRGNVMNEDLVQKIKQEYDILLARAELNFDIDEWLNPKFEWDSLQDKIEAFGEFLMTNVVARRDYNVHITLKEIDEVVYNGNCWRIKLNSGNNFLIEDVSMEEATEMSSDKTELWCIPDREIKFKFHRFLKELFDEEIKGDYYTGDLEKIYRPKYRAPDTIYLK